MNNYVVGVLNFFDNDNELYKVEANNELEAINEALLAACKTDEAKDSHKDWWEEYGSKIDSIDDLLFDLLDQELAVTKPMQI